MDHPVFIVDDEVETRDTLALLLGQHGYRTATAANGEEALALLRGGLRPCLILLDLSMPVKDGVEFRKEQRRDATIAHIPVVMLSGHGKAVEHYEPLLKAEAYLRKPILQPDDLLDVVRRYCAPAAL